MEKYEYNKSRLPEIVLTKHRKLEDLYDYAFKTAFKNIDYIDKPGWKPQLTCYPGIGPQKTLYVPRSLIKKGENEVAVFESDGLKGNSKIKFTDKLEY